MTETPEDQVRRERAYYNRPILKSFGYEETFVDGAEYGEAYAVQQIMLWIERGCPVYLAPGDDIARPILNGEIACAAFRAGLAALEVKP